MAKVISALLFLVAIPACDGGSTPASGNTSISLPDFPAAYVDAVCSHAVRCGLMPDQATCVAATSADIVGQASADVGAGKVGYDPNEAAACLDAVRSASCNYVVGDVDTVPQPCWDIFNGTVAAGGACYIADECISGSCSFSGACAATISTCCPGTCDPGSARPIPIGGTCNQDSGGCIDGAFCDCTLNHVSGTSACNCQAKAAAGQSCGPPECVAGTYCFSSGLTSTCTAFSTEGQPCDPSQTPHGSPCDSTLDYCDSVTLTCVPRIPVGGACTSFGSCVGYATCDATGHCLADPRAGESCDSLNGPHCLGSLGCSSGTCVLPPAHPVCK